MRLDYYPILMSKVYYTIGLICDFVTLGTKREQLEYLFRYKEFYLINNIDKYSGGCEADWTVNNATAIRAKYGDPHKDNVGFLYHWDHTILIRFNFMNNTMYMKKNGNIILSTHPFDRYVLLNPQYETIMNRFKGFHERITQVIKENNDIK